MTIMSKTPGRKFAEGVALDIVKQDRQLISSRAIGMIAAEFDAATAECDCPTTPASAARDALVAAAVKLRTKKLIAAAYNGTSLTEYSPLQIAFEIASDELDAATTAYLAAQEPTP